MPKLTLTLSRGFLTGGEDIVRGHTCQVSHILTVTVATVTCSAPLGTVRPIAHSRVHSVLSVTSMKQKTLQFVLE